MKMRSLRNDRSIVIEAMPHHRKEDSSPTIIQLMHEATVRQRMMSSRLAEHCSIKRLQ
jgi:hypothetical protein